MVRVGTISLVMQQGRARARARARLETKTSLFKVGVPVYNTYGYFLIPTGWEGCLAVGVCAECIHTAVDRLTLHTIPLVEM